MNQRKGSLLVVIVFAVVIAMGAVVIGLSLYEPPAEIEIFSAEVVRYDDELNVLLIREGDQVNEVLILDELVVLSTDGSDIDVAGLVPGQQIRLSCEQKSRPALAPRSPEAYDTHWFCIKIEVIG